VGVNVVYESGSLTCNKEEREGERLAVYAVQVKAKSTTRRKVKKLVKISLLSIKAVKAAAAAWNTTNVARDCLAWNEENKNK